MPSAQTFAAHCAGTGVLLLAYTVFVLRRLAAFRVACLPAAAVATRGTARWMPALRAV